MGHPSQAALVDWLIDYQATNPDATFSEETRAPYAAACDEPDAVRAANSWHQAAAQDIADAEDYPTSFDSGGKSGQPKPTDLTAPRSVEMTSSPGTFRFLCSVEHD
ncbi:hypothetical protein [Streptomyces sp. NPDC057460]|uniref:hypothetical protein n=1 Tax=Streptomyces sp. NPDC057460 TaxID=3346141 RepID=UPI00368FFDE6